MITTVSTHYPVSASVLNTPFILPRSPEAHMPVQEKRVADGIRQNSDFLSNDFLRDIPVSRMHLFYGKCSDVLNAAGGIGMLAGTLAGIGGYSLFLSAHMISRIMDVFRLETAGFFSIVNRLAGFAGYTGLVTFGAAILSFGTAILINRVDSNLYQKESQQYSPDIKRGANS